MEFWQPPPRLWRGWFCSGPVDAEASEICRSGLCARSQKRCWLEGRWAHQMRPRDGLEGALTVDLFNELQNVNVLTLRSCVIFRSWLRDSGSPELIIACAQRLLGVSCREDLPSSPNRVLIPTLSIPVTTFGWG